VSPPDDVTRFIKSRHNIYGQLYCPPVKVHGSVPYNEALKERGERDHCIEASTDASRNLRRVAGRNPAGTISLRTRLPSELELCKRFQSSRITVAKAINSLRHEGLVVRRAGSGSYVQLAAPVTSYQFGLLIPELGSTEIFEPICQGIHAGAAG
jgi:hypothetical protein